MPQCSCCGYASEQYREFVKPPPERNHRNDPDMRVCRSEDKCINRSSP